GELAPRVDELVEVLVERLERPSEDVPVQLLADQREVDELDERCLELPSDLLALMLPQRGQVRFVCDRCHVSSFSGLSLPNESCPEHLPQSLELRWEASLLEVDAVAAHRHTLTQQQLALPRALRQAAVGPDDALPRQVVVGLREDEADEARGARIDVAVGPHEALRYRADALDDPFPPGLHGLAISRRLRPRQHRDQDERDRCLPFVSEDDAAVCREAEARVVRDLPHVAVEVAEGAGVAAIARSEGSRVIVAPFTR